MLPHKIYLLHTLLIIVLINSQGLAFNNLNQNKTKPFHKKPGLNLLGSKFQNILEGNKQVSVLEMLRGVHLWQRELHYKFIDPESALRYNRRQGKLQREIPFDAPFPCDLSNARSLERPRSVHKLRPGDIDILAVLGDSISAGNSVITTTFAHVFYESRGVTFSGGGRDDWRHFLTLPNILKVYNPNLYGYAIADGLTVHSTSRLHLAEPTVMSRDLLFQARVLLKRMRSDPNVDMQHHWKLLTIFIGNVDFCGDLCFHGDVGIPLRRHEKDMLQTLRFLRDNVPRLFVNFLTAPNGIHSLHNMKHIPFPCTIMHRAFCGCFINATYNDADRAEFEKKIHLWQDLDAHIVNLPEFQTDDFAVTFQPFIANPETPILPNGETDLRFFANDCFHFSQLGHAAMANSLWNNMIQPVGQKQLSIIMPFERFECPTEERPFFATLRNS